MSYTNSDLAGVECSVLISTYGSFLSVVLANKTSSSTRKHCQCGKLSKLSKTQFFFPSFEHEN